MRRKYLIISLVLVILSVLILFLFLDNFISENGDRVPVVWSKFLGGTGNDMGRSVTQKDDGYVVIGDTSSLLHEFPDFLLIKLDIYGNVVWERKFGGEYSDIPKSVVQTTDGGYAIAGATNSFGAGNYDFWLVKVDAEGNIQWNTTYGGNEYDYANSVIQTVDGGYVIAGHTGWNPCVVKVGVTGIVEWNRTYGEDGEAHSVAQTVDGGYALAGYILSFRQFDVDQQFWLSKINSTGHSQWNRTYGGLESDYAYSAIQTFDEGYLIVGTTNSFGAGENDVWMVKTDANGEAQWNKTHGGADIEEAYSVVQTNDGGYVIAGAAGGFEAPERLDCLLIKMDPDGNMEWNKTYGGSNWDRAYCVRETSDGGYILAGYTASFGHGLADFWIMKTDNTGEISD